MTTARGGADQYRAWARQHIGGTEQQIEAAAQELLRQQAAGASGTQAANAAKAAARRVGSPQPPRRQVLPAPPGTIVGIARDVKQTTQFGTFFQILDFELDRSDGLPVRVQVRGQVINGRIDVGDEIIVDSPRNDARFIQADRVFNRTSNSYVEAPKGVSSLFAETEAAYGKGMARAHRGIVVGVMIWVAAIFLFVIGGFLVFLVWI